MTALEILTGARALLSDKGAWTKGESWRTADGEPTMIRERAACFCVYGAIAAHVPTHTKSNVAANRLIEEVVGYPCANEWNDAPERKHSEVLEALDKAIELAKERNL